ncbi:hypothetical protein [Pseudohalioglobus lutimaris]|uniref:Uncharacterized protein n=1 Tax=Pseudohalioglobus lutimaris TaxID=1737061 RepID=A0A2N5X0Z2_9GAMM|nr:hypothetical protein [Pseudohalioglobus lutimaris]PLW68157.1 hypothetical protein C0039_13255 [Pseudohalioglobus lutimaris]
MPTKKSSPSNPNPESSEERIEIIKEARCKSLEGSAHLTYQIGRDKAGEVCFRISKNTGGGFFSNEWVEYWAIERAIKEDWPQDKPITSIALRGLFRGKSVNTPSFLMAVLRDVGLLEPVPGRKRIHQPCDPKPFLNSLGKPPAPAKKKAPRKSPAKAKAKSAPRSKAPAKTSRKRSPASKKKA